MEALHGEVHSNMPREAPRSREQEEIGQRVDDLFQLSDLEIARILSRYLEHPRGNECGG